MIDFTAVAFSPNITMNWLLKFWSKNKDPFPIETFVNSTPLKSFYGSPDNPIDINIFYQNIKNYYQDKGEPMKIYITLELNSARIMNGPRNLGNQDNIHAKLYVLQEWITELPGITNNVSTGLSESSRNYLAIQNNCLEIIDLKLSADKNVRSNTPTKEEKSLLTAPIIKNGQPCGTVAMSWVSEGHAIIKQNQFLCFLLACYCSSFVNTINGVNALIGFNQFAESCKTDFKIYSL